MNIIYKLTNLDRDIGRRFYIGSKAECTIETIDDIDRIVSLKTGLPYYGSSTCPLMKEDMKNGHRLHAELLEEVPDKKNLLDRENYWIRKLNAVDSPDFYNIAYAIVGGHMIDQTAAYNMYGETIVSYGKATSSMNKRQNTAKRFGYKNMGEFCVWLYTEWLSGKSYAKIAEEIGWERHAPYRYRADYDMEKCLNEYFENDFEMQKEIRSLVAKGVSAKRIAELKGLELPTVCLYIGDYDQVYTKAFLVAHRRGYTKDELEKQVVRLILKGHGFLEAAKELSINETSAKRYFLRYIRAKLDPDNL